MPEEKNKKSELEETKGTKGPISRREFLRDAGLVVGGATVGSLSLMNACGKTETVTVGTATVTNVKTITAGAGSTVTVTIPNSSNTIVPKAFETTTLVTVKLTVNKQTYQIQVEPEETLHQAIRNKIGFLSLKEMCSGYGACGSCSLIMNGRPVLSCMALACECNGAVIETAEGIADAKHPLVDAYILNQCMQCGYCTPGFLVTAKALLDNKPKATETDIREALGGNICRCGSYPAHITAVLSVAK
jgi:aerobic-type carbon monoxide dehydrogenase small subunit (CoxS/CutS family)